MTPDTAMSERQLAAALAAGGRMVSVTDISTWRKAGLLPPLTSHGLGQGKGKAHCWHDSDIVARARFIFDAARQYGRNDQVLLMLFLSGFAVPLPQLRRAWQRRAQLRKPPAIRQTPRMNRSSGMGQGAPLLEMTLAIGAAIQTDHHIRIIPLLERAVMKLGYARPGHGGQICHVLMAMESALVASDLVGAAHDMELADAQRYLTLGLNFLRGCAEQKERDDLSVGFGPTLFVFILALLRSGQRGAVEQVALQIEDRVRSAPVRNIRKFAGHVARQVGAA